MTELKWIEVNLPWHVRIDYEAAPKPPNLDEDVKAKFGVTENELASFYNRYLADYRDITGNVYKVFSELPDEEQAQNYDEFRKTYLAAREAENPELFAKVAEYRERDEAIADFCYDHPLMIEWQQKRTEWDETQKRESFCRQIVPGMLIEFASGARHLVGSINAAGGVCDDCAGVEDDDDVVVRYAMVFDFSKEANENAVG